MFFHSSIFIHIFAILKNDLAKWIFLQNMSLLQQKEGGTKNGWREVFLKVCLTTGSLM